MAVAPPLNPGQLFERERLRWRGALQQEDQRLWDATDMLRKAANITYGMKPEKGGGYDIPPHVIVSAHISTAMQGSIFPGQVDSSIRAGPVVLANGDTVRQTPFTSTQRQVPPGIGDKNTDQLLQTALKNYLTRGELELRSALTFNDRPGRGV